MIMSKKRHYPPAVLRYREKNPTITVSIPKETKERILVMLDGKSASGWFRKLIQSLFDEKHQKRFVGEVAINQMLREEREELKKMRETLKNIEDEIFEQGFKEGVGAGRREERKEAEKKFERDLKEAKKRIEEDCVRKAIKTRLSMGKPGKTLMKELPAYLEEHGDCTVSMMLNDDGFCGSKDFLNRHENLRECLECFETLVPTGRFFQLDEIFK